MISSLAAIAALAKPAKTVSYKVKPAARGQDVRLRRLYSPGHPAIGSEALMQSPRLVSAANYDAVKVYATSVLAEYPPDRYFYVGVGRTPGPVIAFLKNLGPDLAANFPSSAMYNDGKGLSRVFGARYREHIEALIPESVRNGDRKLLLLDSSSGTSLRGLRDVLDGYRAAGGAMPPIEMLSIGARAGDIPSIIHDPHAYWEERDEVAEFTGEQPDGGHIIHSPGGTLGALVRNPKYAEHRRSLYKRMVRDADLDGFLNIRFPHLLNAVLDEETPDRPVK